MLNSEHNSYQESERVSEEKNESRSRRWFGFINSLPFRLSFYISLLLLAFVLAAMSVVGWLWFSDVSRMLSVSCLTSARETAYRLDTVFRSAELSANAIAGILERVPPEKERVSHYLKTLMPSIHQKCPEISGIALVWNDGQLVPGERYNFYLAMDENGKEADSDGEIRYTEKHDASFDYYTKDWFLVPVMLEKPVWTIPFRSEAGLDSFLLSYAVPFYKNTNGQRNLAGTVIIDIRMNTLDKYLQNVQRGEIVRLSKNAKMFLTNQFGQIVISPDDSELLSKTIFSLCEESETPNPADRKAAQSMYKNYSDKIRLESAPVLNSASDVYYASCVNEWVVCIAIDANWTSAILFPMFLRFLAAWLVGIAIIVGVIFFVCHKLSKPLVKLAQAAQAVGQGAFDAPLPAVSSSDEIGNLTASFRRMQSELTDYIARLKESVAARERAECELNLAKTIQQDILPRILPPFSGYNNVKGAADLIPARGVGGDLYDVFPLDEFHLALIIGDVSGKGVPAAMFMVVTQTLQRSIAHSYVDTGALVTQLNNMLSSSNDANMFVTYWVGILDIRDGSLNYTSGGHNPPLIKRKDGTVEWLRQHHGFPLGAIANFEYGGASETLREGDSLILYTDGVTEAFSSDKEQFGEQRLFDVVNQTAENTPAALLESIKKAVFDFTKNAYQSDDITLLIVQRED